GNGGMIGIKRRTAHIRGQSERPKEMAARAHAKFLAECICFPEKEPACVVFPIEEELILKLPCRVHGQRRKPYGHLYMAPGLRQQRWQDLWTRKSEQYRKAWLATFPPRLWPGVEEEIEGEIFLRLKDGTRIDSGYRTT